MKLDSAVMGCWDRIPEEKRNDINFLFHLEKDIKEFMVELREQCKSQRHPKFPGTVLIESSHLFQDLILISSIVGFAMAYNETPFEMRNYLQSFHSDVQRQINIKIFLN